MNREIKFRVWDASTATMAYQGVDAWFRPNVNTSSHKNQTIGLYTALTDKSLIPMQFTGLHDKNGKEIYEGDVVRFLVAEQGKESQYYERKEVVQYYCGSFRVGSGCLSEWSHENGMVAGKLRDRRYIGFGQEDIYMIDFDLEVIGNVYQNPELLNLYP